MNKKELCEPLALRPADAARKIGVSQRTLWSWTKPRGTLPCCRVGRVVLYRLSDLHEWLRLQTDGAAEGQGESPAANVASGKGDPK